MARLTWENVAAPNFSGVGDSLRTAASLMSNATSGFAGALGDFQKASERDAGNQLMQRALGMTDRDQLNAALQSGTMFAGINGADRGALEFLANRDAALLRNQGAMLDNRNTGYNYDRAVIDNQRADTRYNTAPQAMNIITQARQLATGGDNAAAQRLLNENSKVLADAGISPERALTMDLQNREASTYTMDFNKTLDNYNEWAKGRGRDADVQTKADYIANNTGNRQQALDVVSKIPGLDTKTRKQLQDQVGALGDDFWPQASQAQINAAAAGVTLQDGNRAIAGNVPGNNPTNAPAVGRGGLRSPVGGSTENMITHYARMYGIDPSVALKVAKSEGGLGDHIQSNVTKNGRREPSYGPFQLLVGGGNTGFPEGLGNRFVKDTGLDPSDPANKEATIAYALREASQKGWGQWYGAKNVGIGNRDGIGGNGSKDLPAFDRGSATGVAGPASGGTQQPTASSVLAQNASDAPQYETSTRAESASRTPAEDLLSSTASSATNAETPQAQSQSQANSGGSDTTTATTEAQTVAGAEANTGVNQTVPPGGIPGSIDQVMNMPQGGAPVAAPVTTDPDAGRQMLGAAAAATRPGAVPPGAGLPGRVMAPFDTANMQLADQSFNNAAAVDDILRNPAPEGAPKDVAGMAKQLREGPLSGVPANQVNSAIAELVDKGLSVPLAGEVLKRSAEGGWGSRWYNLGLGNDQVLNMDKARSIADSLAKNPQTKEFGAASRLNTQSQQTQNMAVMQAAQTLAQDMYQELMRAQALGDPEAIAIAQANYNAAMARLNQLEGTLHQRGVTPYNDMTLPGSGILRQAAQPTAAEQRIPAARTPPPGTGRNNFYFYGN